jgi:hypothetical protein
MHLDTSTMSYQSTTIIFTIMSTCIPRWTRNKGHHRIWQICFISRYYTEYWLQLHYMTNVMILTAIVNFPFLCSNIPLSPYGVYISQWIRYARACFACGDFSKRGKLLAKKLMLQGYNESRLSHHFANSTVVIMALFVITNYHLYICWMTCFIEFVRLSFPYWLWRRVIPYT